MALKTFFLLLLAVLVVVRGEEEEVVEVGEVGEVGEGQAGEVEVGEGEEVEEYPSRVTFCFITTPKGCQAREFELADFFLLPDNGFPGLIFKNDPEQPAGTAFATFFDQRRQLISRKEITEETHQTIFQFFAENDFPLVDLTTFNYGINTEFDFGGHHYQVAYIRVPYQLATDLASMREYEIDGKMEKGYVAQIDSQEEQDEIMKQLAMPYKKFVGFSVWLGGHKDLEKLWTWEHGEFNGQEFYNFHTQESSMFTAWAPDRPFRNERNSHRCVALNKRGEWEDVACFIDTKSVIFEFGTSPQEFEKQEEKEEEQQEQQEEKVEEEEKSEL